MKIKKFFLLFVFSFFLISCSKDLNQKSEIKEKNLDLQVLEAYQGGINALEEGDVLLSTSALAFYLGNDIWKSSFLGSIAAAIQVSRIGNVPMQQNDLINTLASLQIKST